MPTMSPTLTVSPTLTSMRSSLPSWGRVMVVCLWGMITPSRRKAG
ncbi:hypothetical protein [Moraxella lacunata]